MSVEIPDYSDLYWGLPPKAVKAALDARRSAPLPSHFSNPEESRAVVMLAAAAPAILESRRERVASTLAAYRRERWDGLREERREAYLKEAGELLGLSDTGEENGG